MCLGKKLQKSFEKDSKDETCRWLANYIAEKIDATELAVGEAKAVEQRQCFEAILLLWEYRSSFSVNTRPFKGFEPIFQALEYLNPNKEQPSFFRGYQLRSEDNEPLNYIIELDLAVNIVFSHVIKEAILRATDESVSSWIHLAKDIESTNELEVIYKTIPGLYDTSEKKHEDDKRKSAKLQADIARLIALEEISKKIKDELVQELEALDF